MNLNLIPHQKLTQNGCQIEKQNVEVFIEHLLIHGSTQTGGVHLGSPQLSLTPLHKFSFLTLKLFSSGACPDHPQCFRLASEAHPWLSRLPSFIHLASVPQPSVLSSRPIHLIISLLTSPFQCCRPWLRMPHHSQAAQFSLFSIKTNKQKTKNQKKKQLPGSLGGSVG